MLDVNDVNQLDSIVRQREWWEWRSRLAPAGDADDPVDQPREAIATATARLSPLADKAIDETIARLIQQLVLMDAITDGVSRATPT